MVSKIQALLRKAEAEGVTQNEAEALSAKAYELAAKYRIENALLHAKVGAAEEKLEPRYGEFGRPYIQMAWLVNTVYTFCGCKMVVHTDGKHNSKYVVFGFTSDLDRGDAILASLLIQGTYRANADYRSHVEDQRDRFGTPDRRSTFKRSWWAHFTSAVSIRFDEIKESTRKAAQAALDSAEDATGPSVAVVLLNRDQAIAQRIEKVYPHLKRGRGVSGGSSAAGASGGRRAGREADLSGGTRKAIG